MEMLITVETILSFVILPLAVILVAIISCGNSRPKHQLKVVKNSQREPMKMGQYGNYQSRSRIEPTKSSKMQKTRSTESRSTESFTKSRKRRSIPLNQSQHSQPSQSNGINFEKPSKTSKKLEEESHELKMEPAMLRWNTSCGMQKVFITNLSNIRQAIKVKCSDNILYHVNPVFSFIEPGQVLAIDVLRENGGAKVDKMIFNTAKAKKEDQNPRAVFQNNTQNPAMVLPLIAT